ncbi:hypothetical protein Tco_0282945 [Tanacetum coccineum]
MGRDTIQLEDAVSTISQEYLLEFSSKYFIRKTSYQSFMVPGITSLTSQRASGREVSPPLWPGARLLQKMISQRNGLCFNLIISTKHLKVIDETRQRTAHEVPLLIATASRVIQMVDATELFTSSGTPSTLERSPLDFSNEDAPPPTQSLSSNVLKTQAAPSISKVVSDPVLFSYASRSLSQASCRTVSNLHLRFTDPFRSYKVGRSLGNQDSDINLPPGCGAAKSVAARLPRGLQDVVDHIVLPGGYGLSVEVEIRAGGQTIEEICGLDLEAQFVAEIKMKSRGSQELESDKELEDFESLFSGLEVVNAHISSQQGVHATAQRDLMRVVKYGVEHGKAGLELTAVEAYDLEADN